MIEQSGIPGKDNHTEWSFTRDEDGGIMLLLTRTDGLMRFRIVAEKATVEIEDLRDQPGGS